MPEWAIKILGNYQKPFLTPLYYNCTGFLFPLWFPPQLAFVYNDSSLFLYKLFSLSTTFISSTIIGLEEVCSLYLARGESLFWWFRFEPRNNSSLPQSISVCICFHDNLWNVICLLWYMLIAPSAASCLSLQWQERGIQGKKGSSLSIPLLFLSLLFVFSSYSFSAFTSCLCRRVVSWLFANLTLLIFHLSFTQHPWNVELHQMRRVQRFKVTIG